MVRVDKKDGANQRQDERSMRDERSSPHQHLSLVWRAEYYGESFGFEVVCGLRY